MFKTTEIGGTAHLDFFSDNLKTGKTPFSTEIDVSDIIRERLRTEWRQLAEGRFSSTMARLTVWVECKREGSRLVDSERVDYEGSGYPKPATSTALS